jgi:hypothetical protein
MQWTVEHGVIRLIGYAEDDALTVSEPSQADVLIVASDHVVSHAYPVEADDAERRLFELEQFLAEVDRDTDHLTIVPSTGRMYGGAWSTILSIPNSSHLSALLFSDIEATLAALLLDPFSVAIGRCGTSWWLAEAGQSEGVHQLIRVPVDEQRAAPHDLQDQLMEFLASADVQADRLVVFGDQVSPSLLAMLSQDLGARFTSIERLQPFHHVRASLDADAGGRVLARAHVLGCMVGAIHVHAGLVHAPSQPLALA